MPDISGKGAHKFWHEYPDPMVYRIISFMESVENWTPDNNPGLEKSLAEFGVALDKIGNIDLQEEEKIIEILACLKIGRALRFLYALDAAHPGAAAKILMYAEKSQKVGNTAELLLKRNITFERWRLLGRVFSRERLTSLLKVLEGQGKDA